MKSRELYGIGIRLIGIYLLFLAMQAGVKYYQEGVAYTFHEYPHIQSFVISAIFITFFMGVSGVIFIKFPLTMAKLISPNEVESIVEFSGNGLALIKVFTCLLGLYIVIQAVPDLFHKLLYIQTNKNNEFLVQNVQDTYLRLYEAVVEFVIGLYLCLRGNSLCRLINRIRAFSK